uniref:Uncharacterized protein n=1 Tax=Meloidogyne javanica TaxID=6303 RepID=A0A915MR31_MELJA
MKKSISRLAQTFTEIFALYEKQRKDMMIIYNLYNKLCEEFALPYKIEKPMEYESRRLAQIAEMIRGIFLKKNDEFKHEYSTENVFSDKQSKQNNLNTSTSLNNGFNGASALVVSGQELLLHELLGVSEKRAKFTARKATCDEIEIIELDDD